MDPHHPDHPAFDPETQRQHDRRRLLWALNLSLAFVLLLAAVFSAQGSFDWRPFAIEPMSPGGLWGILTAPLLHGSIEHIAANATALLILGTLAGSVYPRATLYALPLVWLGAGLGPWWLGDAGTHHLGASGLTHGLMFMIFMLGLLRRDRAAIAAGMIAFLFYGGMVLTVLPREAGVSWQAHMGGAVAGFIAAFLFRKLDPMLPRKRYSWEIEEEEAAKANDELELPTPQAVPILWQREQQEEERGVLLRFPPREPPDGAR
ncbi:MULTISPECIES: rhomboid family intramembrane serine protease [unclassified Pseudoxanthomonas]|jgi:membrane associated rhomboid family serine protease|uniref:rhomboid family intramembrane serine protease n=1 Tax=unclassified Pseudoxanthomonas TaxID=2645906 RepID=UPI0030781EA4